MPYECNRMGIGPLEYGLFFAMISVGYILGNFINRLRVGVVRMAYVGSLLTVLVPMLMLAGSLTGLLTPLLLSFFCFCFGVCNGLVIALGGADYFNVTASGLLIMALCAALSSFLAPNSR